MIYTEAQLKQLTDLELILQYQAKDDPRFFNFLLQRYQPLIKSQASYIHKRCEDMLSYEESKSEAMVAFYSAVSRVDIRKLRNPREFSFKMMMVTDVQAQISSYVIPLKTKKRGYTVDDTGKAFYLSKQEVPHYDRLNGGEHDQVDYYIQNETVQAFYASLTSREMAVFKVLTQMEKPVMKKAMKIAGFSENSGIAASLKKKYDSLQINP